MTDISCDQVDAVLPMLFVASFVTKLEQTNMQMLLNCCLDAVLYNLWS